MAVAVQGAGEQLLAHAGLAQQQDVDVAVRRLFQLGQRRLHGRAAPRHLTRLQFQAPARAPPVPGLQHMAQGLFHIAHPHRLHEKIPDTAAQGFFRRIAVAVARDDHDVRRVGQGRQLLLRIQTVAVGQEHVQKDDVHARGRQTPSLGQGGRAQGLVPQTAAGHLHHGAHQVLVIHYQHTGHPCLPARACGPGAAPVAIPGRGAGARLLPGISFPFSCALRLMPDTKAFRPSSSFLRRSRHQSPVNRADGRAAIRLPRLPSIRPVDGARRHDPPRRRGISRCPAAGLLRHAPEPRHRPPPKIPAPPRSPACPPAPAGPPAPEPPP